MAEANDMPHRRGRLTPEAYVRGIQDGDRTVLSRAITLLESTLSEDRTLADRIVEACLPASGDAMRIGITGVPGAGKSTLIEALGTRITSEGRRLAVLAVDPSSERTRGSILGDKTRMEQLARSPNAYIRPSPTAGSLGGVAQATRETIILCEAAGFDVVFVETTGVGQAEYAVRGMVDFFLLLVLAGAGDDLQGIKRGIMEVADAVVVTKADGANVQAAEDTRRMYASVLKLLRGTSSGWRPRMLAVSALENRGIGELWDVIQAYFAKAHTSGALEQQRTEQARNWMRQTIDQRLRESFFSHPSVSRLLPDLEAEVLGGRISPRIAAERLLAAYRPGE